MEKIKRSQTEERSLQFVALAYHAVMLVSFVVGMYGLISLFTLASEELQRSVQIISAIP